MMFIVVIFFFLFVLLLIMFVFSNVNIVVISFKLFNSSFFSDLEILVNIWSLLFLLMVIIISLSVLLFSFSYMSSLFVSNFIFLYVGFVVSMLVLILNNNFYWMMFGWDGLGVISFLLIIFYMNFESINNGLFTLFQNRFGDLFFILFILGMLDLSMWSNLVMGWGLVFLIIGSGVKSAQFPFNSWLLSAMSAPTPISSLVHSSTLVVAGVFILLQYSYCLYDVLNVVKFVSLLTLIFSTVGLLNENDMKKLIAYSTMSHVSLMLYLLSLKLFKVTYFHLNIHAMFKSLMFMCFGFVMLSSFHAQDKRLVLLINLNPLVKILYYFSCLCLGGLPFLSAFFSKDFIIEKFMEFDNEVLYIFLLLLFLSVSSYYSMKLLNLVYGVFVYSLIEKSFNGLLSVFLMSMVMVLMINLYISLLFSVTLELISFKLFIYLLILGFFILSLMTNLNFKFISYDLNKNFKEMWLINFYMLDQFVYWHIFLVMEKFLVLNSFKYVLLMNWWVLLMVVVIF